MANTSTTAPINVYFANVLSNQDLDLLHDDDIWTASAALTWVPTLLGRLNDSESSEDDIADLRSHLSELCYVFSGLTQEVPNAELDGFTTSLKATIKNPGQVSQAFLADFSRIVDAFLTEGSKVLRS